MKIMKPTIQLHDVRGNECDFCMHIGSELLQRLVCVGGWCTLRLLSDDELSPGDKSCQIPRYCKAIELKQNRESANQGTK